MNSDPTPPFRIEHRVARRLAPLLEFDGQTVAIGKADETINTIASGIKVWPFVNSPFDRGVAVILPVTEVKKLDFRRMSAFYHF